MLQILVLVSSADLGATLGKYKYVQIFLQSVALYLSAELCKKLCKKICKPLLSR